MATQTQGKGKKKNKEVMKFSLDEFNQINAPHGHSVVNVKYTGLDWAATMADHDQQVAETQQIIVPTAPRAQRGPNVDYDSLPTEPPFRISLFHVPIAAEEKDITDRFFNGIKVQRVDIQKASTTVELSSREDMYEALCKDGSSIKGKTISVCLYGQQPQNNYNQDRYGGRGSNSSYGERSYQTGGSGGGFGSQRLADKYGDRSGGYSSDRDSYNSYSRPTGGSGTPMRATRPGTGSYGQRFENKHNNRDSYRSRYTTGEGEPSEEPENWRARATNSPLPTHQPPPPPQPLPSDEVENWRARPTVKQDPPPAPSSAEPPIRNNTGGQGFNNQRMADRHGDRSGGYSYNYNRPTGGPSGMRPSRSGPGASGGYNRPRFEGGYNNNRDNYRNRYPPGGEAELHPTPSDEVENWRARPTVKQDGDQGP